MKLRFLASAALLAAFTVVPAMADPTVALTGFASPSFTLDETSSTTATVDGYSLSLIDASTLGQGEYHTILANGGSWSLIVADGSVDLFLILDPANFVEFNCQHCSSGGLQNYGGAFKASPVPTTAPEGSSIAMMGMTGIGLLGALKRKFTR
jgi:hypothetical protein